MNRERSEDRTGTESMPGNYPTSSHDSTASGGYGSNTDSAWLNKAQRGLELPTQTEDNERSRDRIDDAGLIDQSLDGTNLSDKLQDVKQGRDTGVGSEDVWGVEKGAEKDF
ncbi:hypothetical protein B0H34DRAFT_735146 [Crassisporium funariophilum]|nr:hypothetical protein B0H34DRAFT_735146 [Crassisporium funariophilum]